MIRSVTHYYPRAFTGNGGVTHAVWLWVASLQRRDVDVEVLYDPRGTRSPEVPVPAGARAVPLAHSGRGRTTRPCHLGGCLRPEQVLVLHSGYVLANIIAARQARSNGTPYLVVPHGAYDPNLRGHRRVLKRGWEVQERRMLHGAVAVHVFFEQERDHVVDLAPGARVLVAPTAYEPPDVGRQTNGSDDYIAWLGRYDVRHKGLDRLLDAAAMVPGSERKLLRLHGRDSKQTRQDVQRLVDQRGLGGSVLVGPPLSGDAKQRFLLGARGYVHPSRWECHSVALVETLALGVPALVTDNINIAESLRRAGAAMVVEGCAAALAGGLTRLGSDDLSELGRRGQALVRTQFSHESAADSWIEGLRRLGVTVLPA